MKFETRILRGIRCTQPPFQGPAAEAAYEVAAEAVLRLVLDEEPVE